MNRREKPERLASMIRPTVPLLAAQLGEHRVAHAARLEVAPSVAEQRLLDG